MRTGIGLIIALVLAGSAGAGIYRSQDQQGHTVFSDRPSAGAEEIELRHAPYRYKARVRQVIDGDTLVLNNNERIRLIGINTPEVENRFSRGEAGGEAARDWLRQKLRDPHIWLEYDVEHFDRYQRRLAHVFTESGEYLNAALLKQGLAMLSLRPPNLRHSQALIQARQQAEAAGRGGWQRPEYQLKRQKQWQPGIDYRGWQRWQLTPRSFSQSRKYLNLIVSAQLMIKIPRAQLDLFLPAERYLNQPLEVRGWMRRRGEQHHFYVQHPSAIILP